MYINNDSTVLTYPLYIRLTPDGRMAVILYTDQSNQKQWLTSAFIQLDGSLQWTGYTYLILDSFDDTVTDYDIVPLYTTDVPTEEWMLLDKDD
jgi:hypothetical protein